LKKSGSLMLIRTRDESHPVSNVYTRIIFYQEKMTLSNIQERAFLWDSRSVAYVSG